MAMDKAALQTAITNALKTRMKDDLNPDADASDFEPFALIMAEEVAGAVIQHILDNAVTSPTGDTIT